MTSPRVGVVVASTGRPQCLRALGKHLAGQTRPPDAVVFSVADPSDLPEPPLPQITGLTGTRGLAAQRNRALQAVLAASDIVAFFDDDYLPSRRAVEGILRFFALWPGCIGVTGRLLADGIRSAGIAPEEAERMLHAHDAAPPPAEIVVELNPAGLYGCNMAFRTAAIGDIRFDEHLPLYGWQEDIDFSARVAAHGRLARTDAFVGVHLGVKTARASGLRLGYSQIANPVYLLRKGSMRPGHALRLMAGNLVANHAKSLREEPWIDRRGRARGNRRALLHALRGRLDPEHILHM